MRPSSVQDNASRTRAACIALGSILEASWSLFRSKWGGRIGSSLFLVGSMLFSDFFYVLTPSWPHFGSILEGLGLDLGGFWAPF